MLKRTLLHLLLALGAGSTVAHAAVKAKPAKAAAAKKPAKAKAAKGEASEADAYLAAHKLEGTTVQIKLPGLDLESSLIDQRLWTIAAHGREARFQRRQP